MNISERIKQLESAKRRLRYLEKQYNKLDAKTDSISDSLFGKRLFGCFISCGDVTQIVKETEEQRKIREWKEKEYEKMVKPYLIKQQKNRDLQAKILKELKLERTWDGEGYETTYETIDIRIKELRIINGS